MVKDMDSYIDRCIGKEDFFKLATVNDLICKKKTCFRQSFCKNEKYFHFDQDVQLLDFTARKMKMPVGEKKKRKDKEGEKVCWEKKKSRKCLAAENFIYALVKQKVK